MRYKNLRFTYLLTSINWFSLLHDNFSVKCLMKRCTKELTLSSLAACMTPSLAIDAISSTVLRFVYSAGVETRDDIVTDIPVADVKW